MLVRPNPELAVLKRRGMVPLLVHLIKLTKWPRLAGSKLGLRPFVSGQKERFALPGLELSRSNFAGHVVADAQSVAVEFVDREEGLAFVWAFGADDVHGLGLRGWIDPDGAQVNGYADDDIVLIPFDDE